MMRRRAFAVAIASLLMGVPLVTLATPRAPEVRSGSDIVERVLSRLCGAQEILGHRVILVDPTRCTPPPPPPQELPTLTLVKVVINDNGGHATTTDFQAMIDDANVSWGVPQTLSVGAHMASESTSMLGYTPSEWGGDCSADGTITLAAGESKTCTITNDDNPPPVTGKLLITEVYYDPDTAHGNQGSPDDNEWVEIHNGMNTPVNLAGYFLHDATHADALPGITLPVGGFIIVTDAATTPLFWDIPEGASIVFLGGNGIGNGLSNTSDTVWLENSASTTVDAVSWGTNTMAFNPAVIDVADGHSIARSPITVDTDTAADWVDNTTPTPGS